ncbi:MAG: hypothetical protein IBJ00_01225 [Alphaproteobacteria bacterium]|nr:hypothetical protein [Alphaproteobacteria bacterium]
MRFYLSKFSLIITFLSFLASHTYVYASDDDKSLDPQSSANKQESSENQSKFAPSTEEKSEASKRRRIESSSSSSSSLEEEKDKAEGSKATSAPKKHDKGKQIASEQDEDKSTIGSSSTAQATVSKEIGEWVGDKELGISSLVLKYNNHIISKEIIEWHERAGKEILSIIQPLPASNRTNFIKARIDLGYTIKDKFEVVGRELPAIFISGHSSIHSKAEVIKFTGDNKDKTLLPFIPINSYYNWKDLGKENYEQMRQELLPLLESIGKKDQISCSLLETKSEGLETFKDNQFQGWLHSEEPLVLYLKDQQATTFDENPLSRFSEILKQIQLPGDATTELFILSIASRNDCCTNCRPLIFEVIQHDEYLLKTICDTLKTKSTDLKKKVLLYSALYEFTPSRPKTEAEYTIERDLGKEEPSAFFLMAGNNQSRDNEGD